MIADDDLADDLVGFEPAELFAAVERQLHRADADRERRESEPVEAQVAIGLLGFVHEDHQPEPP